MGVLSKWVSWCAHGGGKLCKVGKVETLGEQTAGEAGWVRLGDSWATSKVTQV